MRDWPGTLAGLVIGFVLGVLATLGAELFMMYVLTHGNVQ